MLGSDTRVLPTIVFLHCLQLADKCPEYPTLVNDIHDPTLLI